MHQIKFIAHDIRCHIIVFDLPSGSTQFCSGNYLKKDNVAFESPILMYSTGNHFQAVFPKDIEGFSNLASNL